MQRQFKNVSQATEFALRLANLLRHEGIALGTLQTLACVESIVALNAVQPDVLLRISATTLINRKADWPHLQRLFALLIDMHFSPDDLSESELNFLSQDQMLTVEQQVILGDSDAPADDDEETSEAEGYSVREVDHHKDFRFLQKQDFPAVLKVMEEIARRNATVLRRKAEKSKHKGVVDLRASMREAVRYDGEVVDWRYKRKKPTHTRLTVLADVSGSMEVYSVFLLNFLHLLNQSGRLKVEVFVFSTELQPLTQYFRMKNFRQLLENVSVHFSGWSGGTKIGHAIATLNDTYRGSVTKKTLVTIMSDGWDTGDTEQLDREMAVLSNRAKSVVWVNPLKGDPSYQPLAIGMATARPYCDEFVSGHSIESLDRFAGLIH